MGASWVLPSVTSSMGHKQRMYCKIEQWKNVPINPKTQFISLDTSLIQYLGARAHSRERSIHSHLEGRGIPGIRAFMLHVLDSQMLPSSLSKPRML